MKIVLLPFILIMQTAIFASVNCTLVKPKQGDTLFIGDTVNFVYQYDSTFIEESGYTGIYIMVAPQTTPFFTLAPLERLGKAPWVPFDDSASGNIRIVIPDTLKKVASGNTVSLHSASSSVIIRMETYGGRFIIDSKPVFTIKKRQIAVESGSKIPPSNYCDQIKYDNGIICVSSNLNDRISIAVTDINGRYVSLKNSGSFKLANGVYIVTVRDYKGNLMGMRKIIAIK